jgi:hypothetical protein
MRRIRPPYKCVMCVMGVMKREGVGLEQRNYSSCGVSARDYGTVRSTYSR